MERTFVQAYERWRRSEKHMLESASPNEIFKSGFTAGADSERAASAEKDRRIAELEASESLRSHRSAAGGKHD